MSSDLSLKPGGRLAAIGSVIGALLASSCCIAPLVLVSLGVSGAWMGNFSALEPYKLYFAAVAAVFLGLGFWQAYRKPKQACEDGSYCANPVSGHITKAVLWVAALLILSALTVDWWAPLFY